MKSKMLLAMTALLAVSGVGCSKGVEFNENFANFESSTKRFLSSFSSDNLNLIESGDYTYDKAENEVLVSFKRLPTSNVDDTDPNRLEVTTVVQPVCNPGEMDVIKGANDCRSNIPLLINMKDSSGEKTLFKIDNVGGIARNEIFARLNRQALVASSVGGDVEVLGCLDSDHDGSCTDEAVLDLNKKANELAPKLQQALQNQGQITPGNCDMYQKGILFYQAHMALDKQRPESISAAEATSIRISGILNNLPSKAEVIPMSNGNYQVKVEMKVAEFNPNVCVKVSKRTNGCFAKGTQVQMSHGKSEKIENLRAGDSVRLADGRTSSIYKVVAGPETENMIEFTTYSGKKLMVTSKHPMATQNGIKAANQVSEKDLLKLADGSFTLLTKIEQKKTQHQVYNFELAGAADEDHLVVANGIVSGELYLQNKISNEQSKSIPFYLSQR